MRTYSDCMRTDGMCGICALTSRGLDCHNNRINGVMYNRTLSGMTQKELSEKTGINIRQIQKYECGECDTGKMMLRNAIALADALECDVRELL